MCDIPGAEKLIDKTFKLFFDLAKLVVLLLGGFL